MLVLVMKFTLIENLFTYNLLIVDAREIYYLQQNDLGKVDIQLKIEKL